VCPYLEQRDGEVDGIHGVHDARARRRVPEGHDHLLAEQRLMGGREERDGGAAVSAGGGGRDFIFRRP